MVAGGPPSKRVAGGFADHHGYNAAASSTCGASSRYRYMSRSEKMLRRIASALLVALAAGCAGEVFAADATQLPRIEYKIVTASERGTYIQIGRDLARFVAPAAGIKLEVLPSAGSAEN